ncbi:phosphodiester glycosidase family protein [bacterium]|nr:phosphodiester glycosidase family protein [bacterium]
MTRPPRYLKILLLLPILLMLGLPFFAGQQQVVSSTVIPAGIEYTHQRNGGIPWSIHIVKIDRASNNLRFETTVSNGKILGLGTVSEQAGAAGHDGWSPVAAINGDFFRIEKGPYQGDMLGLQITSGTLISSPSGPSFWIGRDGSYHIGQVSSRINVTWPSANPTTRTAFVAGLNGPRTEGRAVLFTTEFGATTRTEDGGLEFVLEPANGDPIAPLTPSMQADLRIVKIHDDGNNDIRPGTMVLSLDEALAEKLPPPEKGAILHIAVKTVPDLTGVVTAIGGGPVLVHNDRINPDADQATRHPRTAIGFNNKHFYMVVVDGRQPSLSEGMTMPELAQFMADLGATEALNMDGGGSSELWMDGQVMNSPSDGHERPIANALVVLNHDKR